VKSRIMYIERKGDGLTGEARIGRVTFTRTGATLRCGGREFQSLKGSGFKANYFDVETGEHYWISGCKKDGSDRLYGERVPVAIDDDVREEYWTDRGVIGPGWISMPALGVDQFGVSLTTSTAAVASAVHRAKRRPSSRRKASAMGGIHPRRAARTQASAQVAATTVVWRKTCSNVSHAPSRRGCPATARTQRWIGRSHHQAENAAAPSASRARREDDDGREAPSLLAVHARSEHVASPARGPGAWRGSRHTGAPPDSSSRRPQRPRRTAPCRQARRPTAAHAA
jgi:hypothetical protein